ncbi:MAG TPA: class I SAM-dependent methyltransferase [Tepidisphaeraceae bacterium]|nr:class I SAM-dependent methyltransferase [Tepidisphaeraceae bacterium]
MHRNSWMMFEKHARPLFRADMRVLEIAPDKVPSVYQKIVDQPTIRWETLELAPAANITYVASNEYSFPIPDNTFDIVVSGNVIEHVKKIWTWMRELTRVTKPGGWVVTVNPVNWAYHANPVDCWRIFPDGMRALHEDAGLTTTVAVYDHLDPTPMNNPSAYPLLKQGLRRLLGKTAYIPWYCEAAIDTLSIGQKNAT